MSDIKCALCNTILNKNDVSREALKRTTYFSCSRCGQYSITDESFGVVSDNKSKNILSYWIRKNQSIDNIPNITSKAARII